jgi:Protein of unknown function with HXXEE motif
VRPIHGRWPKVAAAAAPAASLAWLRARGRLDGAAAARWSVLPALLWHQTEEWVWPGGFVEWFNREVLESPEQLAPLTLDDAVFINVPLGWGTAVAAGAIGRRVPVLPVAVLTMHAGNAVIHISEGVAQRRWNPGMATSLALFAPMAVNGLRRIEASGPARAVGVAVGTAISVVMMRVMRRRAAAMRAAAGAPAGSTAGI